MAEIIPFQKCHGCNSQLEPLAQIRIYHSQCDPQGKVNHLRRLLSELFRVHEAMESTEFGPPGYDEVMAEVRKELGL